MKFKRELINKLSREHGVDPRVVQLVVDYPFSFARKRMADDEDDRPIRLRYLGVFVKKGKHGKEEVKADTLGDSTGSVSHNDPSVHSGEDGGDSRHDREGDA